MRESCRDVFFSGTIINFVSINTITVGAGWACRARSGYSIKKIKRWDFSTSSPKKKRKR